MSKIPNPGDKLVWRVYDRRNKATADVLSLADEDPREMSTLMLRHPTDHTKYRVLDRAHISEIEPLLVEILREGKLVYELPTIDRMREQRQADLNRLDVGVQRIVNPHIYHVSLTEPLWRLKQDTMKAVRY
jgi:nicotinate phosphoribosyltransferase